MKSMQVLAYLGGMGVTRGVTWGLAWGVTWGSAWGVTLCPVASAYTRHAGAMAAACHIQLYKAPLLQTNTSQACTSISSWTPGLRFTHARLYPVKGITCNIR